jgi:hypothetical protein
MSSIELSNSATVAHQAALGGLRMYRCSKESTLSEDRTSRMWVKKFVDSNISTSVVSKQRSLPLFLHFAQCV